MADAAKQQQDVLHRASVMVCQAPDISHLRPEELAALHVFKHKLLAAGFQLYEKISPQRAHPVLMRFLQQLVDEIENNADQI